MRTIDITTTQKVTIEYELADLRDRIVAYVIDLIIIVVGMSILVQIGVFLSLSGLINLNYFVYLVVLPFFFFYTLVWEILSNGQTLGKKAFGLKVIQINGKQATPSDYVIRWIFRSVDIYLSFGAVAALMISSSEKSQRLGGLLSNTTVIKLSPSSKLDLHDLLKINSLENYALTYPGAKRFSEEDMLLAKSTLDKYEKYRNDAHWMAILEISEKMADTIDLREEPNDPVKFIKTLINDYIVLTR